MARPKKIQPVTEPDTLEVTADTIQVKPQDNCTCDQLPKDGMSYKCTDCVDREFNFRK